MKAVSHKYRSTDPIWIIAETKDGSWSSRIRRCFGFQWKTGFIGWIRTDPGDFIVDHVGERRETAPVDEQCGKRG